MIGRIAIVTLITAVLSSTVKAQESPITWSLKMKQSARPLRSGAAFTAQVVARIKDGWHLYAMDQPKDGPTSTNITLPASQPFKLSGAIKAPMPETTYDEFFQTNTKFYESSVVFTLPLSVSSRVRAGRYRLKTIVSFQACSVRLCLPPKTVPLDTTIRVVTRD